MTGRRGFLGMLAGAVAGVVCGKKLLEVSKPSEVSHHTFHDNVVTNPMSGEGVYVGHADPVEYERYLAHMKTNAESLGLRHIGGYNAVRISP